MKYCFICPTAFINDAEIGGQSDFLLALSHLIDDEVSNEYSKAVLEFGKTKPIYLDNGLFENHSPEGSETLIRKAMKIGASYVFAPDFLYNKEQTENSFTEFYEKSKNLGAQFKFAYVVQADNSKDYLEAFRVANSDPRIDMIGLSILSVPKSFQEVTDSEDITANRIFLINQIAARFNEVKPCHMLGLGGSLADIEYAQAFPFIDSNDSSSAFQTGKFLKNYDEYLEVPGGKIEEKVDFDQQYLDETQRRYIIDNIKVITNL